MNTMTRKVLSAAVVLATLASSAADLAFAPVNPTWTIPFQVTTNGTAGGVYSPVSVIMPTKSYTLGFGVTNATSSAQTLPAVSFRVQDASGAEVLSWTRASGGTVPACGVQWFGGDSCNDIRTLSAGNYRMEARLGSYDTAYFRFAVRSASDTLASVFTGAWSDISARSGNDFAPPPFATGTAASGLGSGSTPAVQFGPYAPMNGIVEYTAGSEKAPLDLVFLVDLTGSMGDCIDGLKASIDAFFDTLVNGDGEHPPITDWRAKVVGYLDYFVDTPWYVTNKFTTSFSEFRSQLYGCTLGYGGDGPESLLDAVWDVSHATDFRDGATKVILAFTDANYKGTGLYDDYADRPGGQDQTEVGSYYNTAAYQKYLEEVAIEAGLAAQANGIIVKVIAENSAYSPSGGFYGTDGYHLDWLVAASGSTNSTYEYVSSFSSYFGDADAIRNLAQSVSATVKEADVVEPLLSAKITGPGILTYEWRNVSSADTNNTFTFKVSGLYDSVEVRPASTSGDWHTSTYALDEGSYTCQWFYRKIDYAGGIVDCGQIRNVTWLRTGVPTALEILGPSEVASGGTASYSAKVTFEDGTYTNVVTEAEWTMSSGGSLASIGQHTGVLSAGNVFGGDSSVAIRATFTTAGGASISATKAVTVRAKPNVPAVNATDGSSAAGVTVSWTISASSLPISSYEVSRAVKGASSWTVLGTTSSLSMADTSATPGVDYTYRVRAYNASGWGSYGSDDGWRAVSISLSPTSLTFGYAAASQTVTVTANAGWAIVANTGCASASAGAGTVTVSVAKNETLLQRTGSVTVTAGSATAHPASATVSVTQGKRPPVLTDLEIVDGATSLEGGESTAFRAIATFDDGTTSDVTALATWSIVSGGKYGTVGAHTGLLSTYETTDTDGKVTVGATYSNSAYVPVTMSDKVDVSIGFTMSLLKPVSLTISGDSTISIEETKPYTAVVTYNNGTAEEKTLAEGMTWAVLPDVPSAAVEKGPAAAMLSAYAGGISLSLSATYEEKGVSVSGAKAVTVPAPITIPVAVDVETPGGAKVCDLEFATSSSASGNAWYGQDGASHDGVDAARSGRVFGEGWSRMETVVTNAGTISFWWKVSSEQVYDKLSFSIDGTMRAQISGTNEWRELSFYVGSGTHTLAWTYSKDAENDAYLDAGWVDQVSWSSLEPPEAPVVSASDGSSAVGVDLSWAKPSGSDITGYEISRAPAGTEDWTVLADGVAETSWTDSTAEPGVDYTYRVRAENEAGKGDAGSDAGWRAISLVVDPSILVFGHTASEQGFAVATECPWSVAGGAGWMEASKLGTDAASVSVVANPSLDARTNLVTVTAGTSTHSTNAVVTVVQAGRPPIMDVGFVVPFVDWRTRVQISTNTTPDEAYAPLSAFLSGDMLDVSFGWTNRSEVAVDLPPVRFRVYRPAAASAGRKCIYEWVDEGASAAGPRKLGVGNGAWSGHWACGVLNTLAPGDYMLEAEIAPEGVCHDIDRSDNTAIFRFAVRDPSLDADDAFPASAGWSNLDFERGNDFAQPPHLAVREGADGTNLTAVQFGPYVPMNGKNGRESGKKRALDLVFLIDYSGSQQASIAGLMNNIGEFMEQLLVGDHENGIEPISDIRIKVAGFSDYKSDRNRYEWFYEGAFTTDRTELKGDLSYMMNLCRTYGGGGYNGGESSYDALYYICKGWVPNKKTSPTGYNGTPSAFRGTNEAARAVIVITDEPPHLPLDADGCSGVGTAGLAAALAEAGVNLTIVGDGEYRSKDSGQPLFKANMYRHRDFCNAYPDMCELIETGGRGTLAEFTGDAEKLRALANNVSSKVVTETVVVEPTFSAAIRGGGTLTFDWKNDSTAGTNNTFTFECDGVSNMVKKAGAGWEDTVNLPLGEGWHLLKWSYGKIGYEGALTDCGVLANVTWKPWETKLEVSPSSAKVEWDGVPIDQTNDENTVVFDVGCNSIWRVVEYPTNWVSVVQGSGSGTGVVVVVVHTNMNYDVEREGFIKIKAGEYGLPSDKVAGTPVRTVKIVQNPHPYIEGEDAQIVSVDVKPRWPWSRLVDVDFRVTIPASGEPVTVKFYGQNHESWYNGAYLVDAYPTAAMLKECPAKQGCKYGFPGSEYPKTTTAEQPTLSTTDSNGLVYMTCTKSGLYRFTWDMQKDWFDAAENARKAKGLLTAKRPWDANGFHTPAFAMKLVATADGSEPAVYTSKTVRVDMRIGEKLGAQDQTQKPLPGGMVLAGDATVGHPYGWVDPVPVNSADLKLFPEDGTNNLNFVEYLPEALSNRYDFVRILKNAYVEGGVISASTTWTADKVHVVRDNVFVAPGATLTIERDAIVKMCGCTRIYIPEDAGETAAERHGSIVVKGAYLVRAGETEYGGDTLYMGGVSYNPESLVAGQGIVYSPNPSTKKIEVDEIYGATDVCSRRAIKQVELYKTAPDALGKVTTSLYRYRYYSFGQEWGDLPRPSESGCSFFGWYSTQPTANSVLGTNLNPTNYEASKTYFLKTSDVPYAKNSDATSSIKVYALLCPTNWLDGISGASAPIELKDASDGIVALSPSVVTYDGFGHMPSKGNVSVRVSDVEVDSGLYDVVCSSGDFVQAGKYDVTVEFTADYKNSPAPATFTILPRSMDGGRVLFEFGSGASAYATDSIMYRRGLAAPTLKLLVDGMSYSVLTNDFDVKWLDDGNLPYPGVGWPYPGKYGAVATPKAAKAANYTGSSITNWLTVVDDPNRLYVECDTLDLALSELAKKPKTADGSRARRILYIGGVDIGGGEEDPVTKWVKKQIRDDFDLNDYIVSNFVCWAENVASPELLRYADGLSMAEAPIIAVVSASDTTRFIARHAGYITAEELAEFLEAALDMPEDASSATLTLSGTSFTYTGSPRKPTVTVRYAGIVLSPSVYDLVWSDSCTDVGTHSVKAVFKGLAYVGETESASFSIVPATFLSSAVALSPSSVPYTGEVQKPTVSVTGSTDYHVDYGVGDYRSVGTYTVTVTSFGSYEGSVAKTFSIVRKTVDSAVVELDAYEVEFSTEKMPTTAVKPIVIAVRDASRTYVEGVDYDIDWGTGDYKSAGTNTITATFKGNYTGTSTAEFVIREVAAVVAPTVEGDPGATVTGDATSGYEVTPSPGSSSVVVAIPPGIDPEKVTVVLSPEVAAVAPNGATVKVVKEVSPGVKYDITEFLEIPAADSTTGVVDLSKADVKAEFAAEALDVDKGAEISLDASEPVLTTPATRPGLVYTLWEGSTLKGMKSGASKVGDGKAWSPAISVKGGSSGFYSIKVGK